MTQHKFTFLDLFSGIGGFYLGAKQCGGTSVGYSEIAADAITAYCSNLGESRGSNLGDITKLNNPPAADLLMAGVPCQSWSIAGKNLGFKDKRGLLWNDTIRVLKQSGPRAFIFENVKGLNDPRNAAALQYIKSEIAAAGYTCRAFLIDSRDYGVLQTRKRLYLIGFKNPDHTHRFSLAEKYESADYQCIGDIISVRDNISDPEVFYLNDLRGGDTTIHSWDIMQLPLAYRNICDLILRNRRKKRYGPKDGNPMSLSDLQSLDSSITQGSLDYLVNKKVLRQVDDPHGGLPCRYAFVNSKISLGINGVNRVYMPNSVSYPTLVASDSNDFVAISPLSRDLCYNNNKDDFLGTIYFKGLYRKITAAEALILQGFSPSFALPPERARWMKLVGNSVTVPVVRMLIDQIIKTGALNPHDAD